MILEFFNKAKGSMTAAQICFDNGLNSSAVNRAYYAAFQAAVAALAHKGIRKDRLDHKWVQAEFNANLIRKTKHFPSKFRAYLGDMQAVRNMADYDMEEIGARAASKQLAKAKEMVEAIGKVLEA